MIEATEVVEAVEVIEAADILRSGKSLLRLQSHPGFTMRHPVHTEFIANFKNLYISIYV